jgi:hypothetical protein
MRHEATQTFTSSSFLTPLVYAHLEQLVLQLGAQQPLPDKVLR